MIPRADGIIVWKMGGKGLYNCMLLMGIGSVNRAVTQFCLHYPQPNHYVLITIIQTIQFPIIIL